MNAVSGNIAIFVPHSGCPQQCSFCNQKTISGTQNPPTGEEAAQLCKDALAGLPTHQGQVEIAFFGGSFTAIPREYMMELLAAVQPYLSDSRVKGIRLSTRPDAIDRRRLDILQSYGVTAIELGAQSMDDRVLAMNRRGHTAQSVRDASALIKEYGFSLGLQMMTGLYG
ncbi:MAG: radical SAM protein, partial [Angelakisella sp.]